MTLWPLDSLRRLRPLSDKGVRPVADGMLVGTVGGEDGPTEVGQVGSDAELGCCCGVIIAAIFSLFDQSILGLGNMMMPSGGSGATWKEDTREIDVLLESFSETDETGSSVNQPVAPPVPPANPVASPGEEAGPANQTLRVVSCPYQPDEVIGGDCLLSIERRLLAKYSFPSLEVIRMARFDAEDRFEVKVEIIKLMAGLDPTGDWMGRGALAIDNPRTATGEESLEKLCYLLDELKEGGVESQTFSHLKSKVLRKWNDHAENSTS
ncbi:unnamed protein product [Fraxinus pennsylvanica]|uniref:DUF8018 domain-containing protein n=1 Tax=Fraxinus pennsylvanica TaxID=56036 RepID=A0AAD2E1T2_9LAMI|nr:unnamed protein product [Fraxinus pennsylvanica]